MCSYWGCQYCGFGSSGFPNPHSPWKEGQDWQKVKVPPTWRDKFRSRLIHVKFTFSEVLKSIYVQVIPMWRSFYIWNQTGKYFPDATVNEHFIWGYIFFDVWGSWKALNAKHSDHEMREFIEFHHDIHLAQLAKYESKCFCLVNGISGFCYPRKMLVLSQWVFWDPGFEKISQKVWSLCP